MSDVVAGLGRLVKGELLLARAEATQGLKAAGAGLGKIVVAGIIGLVALNALTGAAVAGLAATGMGPAWAGLIVGLVLALVAYGLVASGRAALRLKGLWPDRALRGIRRDAEAVRAGMSGKGAEHVGL
jgi:hypothetical protein